MFFAPFLFLYYIIFFVVLGVVFALLEIGAINYAFQAIGLPPDVAIVMLLASLLGSYINIPVTRIESGAVHHERIVTSFGIRYRVPVPAIRESTVVALNVGGALVPALISIYVLLRQPWLIAPAIVATAIVAFVVHRFARPIKGLGIATPIFIPPIVAALCGALLAPAHCAGAVAYVSGVTGTLIGADLSNMHRIAELGAPVASIGGAGTFDGIFLTGIVAVLLA